MSNKESIRCARSKVLIKVLSQNEGVRDGLAWEGDPICVVYERRVGACISTLPIAALQFNALNPALNAAFS